MTKNMTATEVKRRYDATIKQKNKELQEKVLRPAARPIVDRMFQLLKQKGLIK